MARLMRFPDRASDLVRRALANRSSARRLPPVGVDATRWLLSTEETIRLAGLLYLSGGAITVLSTLLPAPAAMNRTAVILVGTAAILIGLMVARLPWSSWPRAASLWSLVPAFILIGTHNHFGGGDPYRYSIFFILCFAWIGITQPRGTSLGILPLFVPAYLVPLITSGHWSPVSASSILYVAPLCVIISETLAWGAQRASAAEQLATMRQDFVSVVSHELRTPLASILGYAELLQARWESLDDQQHRTRVDYIVTAANRQLSLIEDLLHVSRLEARDPSLDLGPVQLSAAVHRAVNMVQGSYRGQVVDLQGSDDLHAFADLSRTEQVLTNLIDNAAKYSPEGAEVCVAWSKEGNSAAVRVYDQGPGISKEGQQVLFMRFGRVPGSRMRAGRVGTGLGLYLGREYAEAMGGTLRLEATGPSGSVFRLCLPLCEESAKGLPGSRDVDLG